MTGMKKLMSAVLIMAVSATADSAQNDKQAALEKLLEGSRKPENNWLDDAYKLAIIDPRMAAWASHKCLTARNDLEKNTPTKKALDEIYRHCWITK